jgi:hypothetical protein
LDVRTGSLLYHTTLLDKCKLDLCNIDMESLNIQASSMSSILTGFYGRFNVVFIHIVQKADMAILSECMRTCCCSIPEQLVMYVQ